MAGVQEKKNRAKALGNFTRKFNEFKTLLEESAPSVLVDPQYEKFKDAWEKLEIAHDDFLGETDIDDIETHKDGITYLDEPSTRYQTIMKQYSTYLKKSANDEQEHTRQKVEEDRKAEEESRKAEDQSRKNQENERIAAEDAVRHKESQEKFNGEKAELETAIGAFSRMTVNVKESLSAENISEFNKRSEWKKVDSEFSSLKSNLIRVTGLAQGQDVSGTNKLFEDQAEVAFADMQKWIFSQGIDLSLPPTSSGSTSGGVKSSTKKESVQLPKFSGCEKTSCFLTYPTWRKQWNNLIREYEPHYRSPMLLQHVDEEAKKKFVGYDDDYEKAMERLEKFYGNPQKVISCVMKEVNSQKPIADGDYKVLVSYTSTLEENYNRLNSISLEHELSNTSTMNNILKKFPRLVSEEWCKHLSKQGESVQLRPFPEFMVWLISQKDTWERMSAIDTVAKKGGAGTYYVQGGGTDDRPPGKSCYSCGETGHLIRDCPKKSSGGRNNKNNNKNKNKNQRRPPNVKKYWCAFHKGDPSRRCWSTTCQELRKMTDVTRRIELLKENGDCQHCCGDHKSEDCHLKERVCGGGKMDRGCTVSHNLHELFCVSAKCFAVTFVHSSLSNDASEEGVLLAIMRVKGRRRGEDATMFYDLGSTSNFVSEPYAKRCGFRGVERTLNVTTLRGTEIDCLKVMMYTCFVRDANGELLEFQAYGLETITGALTNIDVTLIRKLFPHLQESVVQRLRRGSHVDYLLGMQHASWHPERAETAKLGGDMWLYRGRLGECIGGRHPLVKEETRKSDSVFHVNHVYHAAVANNNVSSHAFEFCESRVSMYTSTCVQEVQHMNHRSYATAVVEEPSDCQTELVDPDLEVVDLPPEHCVSSESFGVDQARVDLPPEQCITTESAISDLQIVALPPEHCYTSESLSLDLEVVDLPPEQCIASESVSYDQEVVDLPPQHSAASEPVVEDEHEVTTSDATNYVTHRYIAVNETHPNVNNNHTSGMGVVRALCHVCKTTIIEAEQRFFQSELLGTVVEPKCGGCRCSKCPVPGSLYSFKEQKQYDKIQGLLYYDEELKCWFVEYPWNCERNRLPRNEKKALQSLISLERNLLKNPELGENFCNQVDAMVERGTAIILTDEQLSGWEGDYYYLPILAAKGKKKWLRLVFDASRRQGGFPSMNDCLDKGPDRFMNNLLSVVIGFRNGRVGCAADIKKFHNRVRLFLKDIHMQRFLWRGLRTDIPPRTYAVVTNNFGVKPANCIATSALHKSADKFAEIYPVASKEVKEQTYVDDALIAARNKDEAKVKTKQIDEILEHADMPNKGWLFSGDESDALPIGADTSGEKDDRVLGLLCDLKSDTFYFSVELELQYRNENGEICDVKITTVDGLTTLVDLIITRRLMLRNVQKIFDPCGWWVPVLLTAKLLLRESWSDKATGWDDPLSDELASQWISFLKSLLSLRDVRVPRSLWPEAEVKGPPMLVIFSDGSLKAFGAAAYIRWELEDGSFWTGLIMAKSKIAPKIRVSVPRMELNGAVLGNRMKNFILKETNLAPSRVTQLVDSSTALGYVNMECGNFEPYEGLRVGEIHSSNTFVEGKLEGWAWIKGADNPADWCTKPRTVEEIIGSDFWWRGPDFLRTDESTWPVKHTFRTEGLEGQKIVKSATCAHIQKQHPINDILQRLIQRVGLWKKMCRVLAWLLRLGLSTAAGPLAYEEVKNAKSVLIKFAQEEIRLELEEGVVGKGRFKKLAPVKGEDGIWRVGSRMRNIVPFTLDAKLPKILPRNHKITALIMRDCHNFCHAGQDGTVSRFRSQGFWSVKAGCLAKKMKSSCVPCRKIEKLTISQPLGEFSVERLSEPVAWGYCQLDLFGPFACRGDVNPRTSKKTWGIVLEDTNSGAVHLDIVQDYSAHAVMMALRRFGSLRGWPGVICSDPGSQLESASGKLDTWWVSMGDSLRTLGSEKNFRWEISPPDSPWRQGKAERRIAVVKKLLKLSVGDSRLTPVELQTILFEISNICNERPIGLSKPRADGSYVVVTPNQLLLGRSNSILPDDAQLASDMPVTARYRLVNHVTTAFWKMWCSHVSPGLVVRQKWHTKSRNLCKGDLVMICEDSKIKAKYKLGVVDEVKVSNDGVVRSATVRYCIIRKNAKGDEHVTHMQVKRSVQRLALILPVEESTSPVVVKDYEHSVECATETSGGDE